MAAADAGLNLARQVEAALKQAQCAPLLIGAAALAAHGYPRHTEDIDLAVAIAPGELSKLARSLELPGRRVDYEPPDPQDPLGGVITVAEQGALPVQVVNFDNPPAGGFPALVRDALERSSEVSAEGLPGRLPTPEDLILFKLYAGGPKSELDILELLTRCRVNFSQLRQLAHGYGMAAELEQLLSRAGV